jgi:hypothetical protein
LHQAVIYEQRGGGAVWMFRQGESETSVTNAATATGDHGHFSMQLRHALNP